MQTCPINLQFCGFGGQGIILSSVIFGTAAVKGAGLNALQTQSYGSEARGGECQAELIVSKQPINSPIADRVDILIAMSQTALERYLARLSHDGILIIDPEMVALPKCPGVTVMEVPATQIASEIGPKIIANMVVLGFIQQVTNLISEKDLFEAIKESLPAKFVEINLEAAKRGMALGQKQNIKAES